MWEGLRGGARSTSQSQHQDGRPHGLAFGVQRNSHAATLAGQAGPLRPQASDLRPQTSDLEALARTEAPCAGMCLRTNLGHATGHATVPESGVILTCNKETQI